MADRREVSWISTEGSRRAKSALAVSLSFVILLSGVAFVSWKGYSAYMDWIQQDDYIGEGEAAIQIIVNQGDGWDRVADTLVGGDVVKDPVLFAKEALKIADGPQPGTWNLKTHLPAKTAAEMLNDPDNREFIKVTIPEGYRFADMYAIFQEELGMTKEEIDAAVVSIMEDPKKIGVTLPITDRLEGVLFPDTYHLYPPMDATAEGVLERMATEFNSVIEEIELVERAKKLGITPMQAVIVASIIEAEVNRDEYRGMVAQVIYNRLKKGMLLQIDTTVNYGLNRFGYADLDYASLEIDTPYNTYMHKGLPPTPINSPGKASLDAAVNPIPSNNLYWVAVNLDTGETLFAETLEQHEKNAALFTQWCNANPGVC